MTGTGDPARIRRRLMTAMALGLLLVAPCALALQAGWGNAPLLLAGVILGALLAASASLGLVLQQLRVRARPVLRDLLDDELSTRNSVRAMAVGYVAAIWAAGVALLFALWRDLPPVALLTAVALAGVIAHVASFAWFERQGDEEGDE